MAIQYGHVGCARVLIANGANVEAKRACDNSTPMMWAAHDADCLKLLIEHGGDVPG
jgi:ankyrin repeat protein